ncbi:stage II sporulation protein P [Fervidibacillus albus]|uniref:Stage II sporulation protein P n=1 Tax=Fervidibacillus albus TaxID=2980026 RepID=A0A9E8RVP8_9BACI|nr:stage II sporulation protein P [Fervidibacillus albus]WAA10905.1 stage II sporulation protein P [Fervidibacillus albus]
MKEYIRLIFTFFFSTLTIISSVIINESNLFFSSLIRDDNHQTVSDQWLLHMLSAENHYFYPETDDQGTSIIQQALQLTTNINLKDVRSLIYEEIPGLFTITSEIIVAGEGTDFTNIPIESSPPIEELLKEREVEEKSLENVPDQKQKTPVEQPEKNTVFIYHSHNRESFLPHLKNTNDPSDAQHKEINITLVGQRLGEELIEKGIGAVVDTTDIPSILFERDWKYWQSYDVSREIVEEALATNENFAYLFDIHRDSVGRNATTTTIDGKQYAKIYFVIGKSHENYKENEKFAIELNRMIEEKYPSLTRGIVRKDKTTGNGVYNQDLSERSIIIEIGGIENTLDELYNTVELFAEIFAEFYYHDAIQVNG